MKSNYHQGTFIKKVSPSTFRGLLYQLRMMPISCLSIDQICYQRLPCIAHPPALILSCSVEVVNFGKLRQPFCCCYSVLPMKRGSPRKSHFSRRRRPSLKVPMRLDWGGQNLISLTCTTFDFTYMVLQSVHFTPTHFRLAG